MIEVPDDNPLWCLWCRTDPDREDAAVQVSLTPSQDVWPVEAVDDVAERLLELVTGWVGPLALRTACVTYDRAEPGPTPWEKWYNVYPWTSALATRDRVRGYYWANLLTGGHVAHFGGLEALRERAAARGFQVQELPEAGAGAPAVVLRAPVPITRFDDELLAACKDLLTPVLIPAVYAAYRGYPLRIIRDPGTAFRRVPPGSPGPRMLPAAHPQLPQDPPP